MDRVEALVHRLAPAAVCDDCIVERLSLGALHQASLRTRELAGTRAYERCEGECALCGEAKAVIRRTNGAGASGLATKDSGRRG